MKSGNCCGQSTCCYYCIGALIQIARTMSAANSRARSQVPERMKMAEPARKVAVTMVTEQSPQTAG